MTLTHFIIVTTIILLMMAVLTWVFLRENRALEHDNSKLKDKCRSLEKQLNISEASLSDMLMKSEFWRLASEAAPDGIAVQDMAGRILWSNPSFSKIHGRPATEVLGKHPLEFAVPPDQRPNKEGLANFAYRAGDSRLTDYEVIENQRADGELFWNQISVSFCHSRNGDDLAVQVCRDVTGQIEQSDQLRTVSQKLEYEAKHDELTGASNRSAFLEYFGEVVDDPDQAPVGILHVDLDNFKTINDTHGHAAGDAVLIHVTNVLQAAVRPVDMVSRIGGDEFVITCPHTPNLGFLGDVASELIKKLSEPVRWRSNLIPCEASIGAAISGEDPNAEDLLAMADFALYEAKRGGRNQAAVYDSLMQNRHKKILQRSSEFADALHTDALDCFFQPKMALDSGEIVGVEALVRWTHPSDGLVSPADLLPIAKDLGLLAELDLKSMSFALREKQKLNEAGFGEVDVAFNASPELLAHPDFFNRLVWEVDRANIDRAQIAVEVLETNDFGSRAEASFQASTIRQLHEAGFQIHLDDFGVGFAGLSHLATLNITGVKLDRSLVSELTSDPASQKIARKIIELTNDLSLKVIAEGVEDSSTAAMLQKMGCNVIQGYFLAKPMPANALHAWLEIRRRQLADKTA